jgi:Pyruvate phosphate dikinase, AMP/ATP-binding domain
MTRLQNRIRQALPSLLLAAAMGSSAVLAAPAATADDTSAQYRRWIVEMKEQPRGPFSGIKWFCRDGRVLAPKDYACAGKGQGWQHGEWSDRTRQMRAQGYWVANLLAGLDVDQALADPGFADAYAQWLVEKFLIATDDGWILRKAQYYRGAVQEEDERETARRLLIGMAAQPAWTGYRFVALRTGARLLPHGADGASAQKVRNMAAALNDRDADFAKLRVKIHNSPEASDAEAVRAWGASAKDPKLAEQARELAAEIDRVYAPRPFTQVLDASAKELAADPTLKPVLQEARTAFAAAGGAEQRLTASAALLRQLRDALPKVAAGPRRLGVLDLSLAAEAEHFRAAAELRGAGDKGARTSRAGMIARLKAGADAAYGSGLIGARERAELGKAWARFSGDDIPLGDYLASLRSLGLLPSWGSQTLRQHFGEAMDKLAAIEPMAELFIQDQLRGSPLLAYSQGLDALTRDANRAAGVQHRLMGREIGAGFTALNPGLARGVLYAQPDMKAVGSLRADGIYLLPETVSELPPVAGILTAGAGNPLSHVQLLARNLGIPNVAVDSALLPDLRRNDGKRIVLAVSPAGLVEINEDGPKWDEAFGTPAEKKAQAEQTVMFAPDLSKLDLKQRDLVSLDKLRADDSGRTVGPKAAKLGELKSRFPDRVVAGVGIPFGLYREVVLDKPYKGSSKTVYQWMVESFRKLEALPAGSAEAAKASEALRAEIYGIVRNTDPGPQFRERLRAAMAREFGPDFKGGVFIRSDTNVEDLPGFTGAGLNLTLFNVVGFDNIVKGISEVWASPYTARAWAWRQSHMSGPEHVYPAVMLMATVPAELSGVMVTQDVDSGDAGVLSVAVNEGVGGAVDGQAAESIRITRSNGDVRLMAVATAARKLVPLAAGGVARQPVSGKETLLGPGEVKQLIAFADQIPKQFPQFGEDGKPVAADVEFAFVGGKLGLLQIRPFNESREARGASYLASMDKALAANLGKRISLKEALQ